MPRGGRAFFPERIYRNAEMRNDDPAQSPRFASRRRLVEYASYYPVRTQERKQSNVFQDVPLLQRTQVRTGLYLQRRRKKDINRFSKSSSF